ncbi:hypothetical protein [Mesorhizobium sp. B4-1-1]|uniref:hypothetical protein n=1 Tax=Mesorhizobium sp. B4-1-1 TaxID=2589890 RepID=UPI0011299EC2|nr:hypothetical protein [Mesorhizobium sp. B4-1-1]TPI10547.1 hypothetical protein FJW10_29305 [Mesorhizobium sp. B4-1-1]
MSGGKRTRTPVLGDHKRIKSKLVTPFNDAFGPMHEVSWVNMMIPELLWIALVQKAWGPRRGVEIITAFTRDVRASDPTRSRTIWAAAGKFAGLPTGVLAGIVEGRPYRNDLCAPLAPLHAHYPEHPMRELTSAVTELPCSEDLGALKELVAELFDRASTSATMVQATATWLAFDAERLKVSAGLALADFPRIEDYPDTDQSQRIAASIRATLNQMFGEVDLIASGTDWPIVFWNRGLELEPCEN